MRIRRDLDQTRWLEAVVRKEPHWKILAPVRLQTLVLRHEPPGMSGDALDLHTRALADAINLSGEAYLTPAVIDGRWAIRVSLGGANTEHRHVQALWRLLCKQAAEATL
jgi:aromatic-L-amino-acid decarboxylase